ncbi:MAG: hypothetical protein K9N07_10700 [Candidatus Cloacimonetes bacterium]|nr:hypothetical protein [Candidatus Cloacimonadota bacterium]
MKEMKEDKKGYLEKLEAKLRKFENKLEKLKDETINSIEEGAEKYDDEVDNLMKQKLELQEKLNELRNTGTDKWSNLSHSFENSLKKLDVAFSNFKKKFNV